MQNVIDLGKSYWGRWGSCTDFVTSVSLIRTFKSSSGLERFLFLILLGFFGYFYNFGFGYFYIFSRKSVQQRH